MVDNFNILTELIEEFASKVEDKNDAYFHLQIIKRNKDTGEGSNSVCLKAYQIDSTHPLSKYENDIKELCERFGARAYINPSPKSKRATAVQMLNMLAYCFCKNDFNYLKRIWNSAAGQVSAIDKYWVIDCDWKDDFNTDDLARVVALIQQSTSEYNNNIKAIIDTKHGKHIITTPFDVRNLKNEYPDLDIHKNNPTLLYVPKSLDQSFKITNN